eukprot:16434987-Heterocapsa_arctica.AAC.1
MRHNYFALLRKDKLTEEAANLMDAHLQTVSGTLVQLKLMLMDSILNKVPDREVLDKCTNPAELTQHISTFKYAKADLSELAAVVVGEG